MLGTCKSCGSFVRGETCPHCERVDLPLPSLAGPVALLLGLTMTGCPVGQADYGISTTDDPTPTETGDTGQE
ncbi:MAG: hypothetical protein H6738_24865 [Alphaproteobacteria bacterium]|nr:hypothetical protein [Alphaproteobacteria bacterium]MCB9700043.1 hypothetical protein [Alphaproteobacteria bacterium]